MTKYTSSHFDELFKDAKDLLRQDELADANASVDELKKKCLEDPMLLYPKSIYRPRFVVWELTLRCNMRCAHCGSSAGGMRENELSPEEALDMADQLGALRCERLTLLGGEPLIREDWEAITARLQKNGVRVNIITNGWMTADKSVVQRIKDAGLTTFAISIDGFEESHDKLRKREGSFERIRQSYQHANEIGGLKLAAVTTITRLVMDDLEKIYQFLLENGVSLWQLQVCTPQGRMERGDPVLATPEDLRTVCDFIVAKKAEGKMRLDPSDNLGYYGPWELEEGFRSTQWGQVGFWNGCQAGCQVMGIDANGDIKGCLSMPSEPQYIEGNIREQSLEEIWNKKGGFAYNREFKLDMLEGYCAECEYRGLCRAGCVSHAFCTTDKRDNPTCLHRLYAEGRLK